MLQYVNLAVEPQLLEDFKQRGGASLNQFFTAALKEHLYREKPLQDELLLTCLGCRAVMFERAFFKRRACVACGKNDFKVEVHKPFKE